MYSRKNASLGVHIHESQYDPHCSRGGLFLVRSQNTSPQRLRRLCGMLFHYRALCSLTTFPTMDLSDFLIYFGGETFRLRPACRPPKRPRPPEFRAKDIRTCVTPFDSGERVRSLALVATSLFTFPLRQQGQR